MSCLHEAASLGDADLLEDGLVKGADPNERDWDWGGRTALHIAASKGDKDCVLLLIHYEAEYESVLINAMISLLGHQFSIHLHTRLLGKIQYFRGNFWCIYSWLFIDNL